MSSRKFPLVLSILLATPGVAFGAGAADVLSKAQVADRYVSYRGIKTAVLHTSGKPTTCTMKVVHLLPDKTRTQYYSPEALAGVIIIDNGPMLCKYYPSRRIWEATCSGVDLSPELINREAINNYYVRILGTDKVAGRSTYVIHALPKCPSEPSHRIWVDRDFFLVMRTQVENSRGRVLNSSRYSSIEINPKNISPSIFKASGRISKATIPAQCPFKIMKPAYIPKSYKLIGMSRMNVNGLACAHIQFSNGSSVISLFERQAGDDHAPALLRSKMTHVITWAKNGVLFTLMGDAPCSELRKMADSTR